MILYSERLEDIHDEIMGREKTEWSNFWYDQANSSVNDRILLVGDSTMRMVRSCFANLCHKPVDMFGCSSGLHDVLFAKQMDIFFCSSQYKYSAIFVQVGHHSRIDESGNQYEEKDYVRFARDYNVLIDYLKQFCENIILVSIFFDVIPDKESALTKLLVVHKIYNMCKRWKRERYNPDINVIKGKKNDIIKRIAEERRMKYCDINYHMLELAQNRKTRYIHIDHIHFENAAKEVIVNEYLKYL